TERGHGFPAGLDENEIAFIDAHDEIVVPGVAAERPDDEVFDKRLVTVPALADRFADRGDADDVNLPPLRGPRRARVAQQIADGCRNTGGVVHRPIESTAADCDVGRRSVTIVPFPGCEDRSSRPPHCSSHPFTMLSPSPTPSPGARVV